MLIKKKNTTVYNGWDSIYDKMWAEGLQRQRELCEAVIECNIKFLKIRLYPATTKYFDEAKKEYKNARVQVMTARQTYEVALEQIRAYYEENHTRLSICATWLPSRWATADKIIENAINGIIS